MGMGCCCVVVSVDGDGMVMAVVYVNGHIFELAAFGLVVSGETIVFKMSGVVVGI